VLSVDSSGAFGLSSVEHLRDVLGRAEALGFDEVVVHWPRDDGVYAGDVAVLERVAADVLPGLDPR
jgi:endonuclease IV